MKFVSLLLALVLTVGMSTATAANGVENKTDNTTSEAITESFSAIATGETISPKVFSGNILFSMAVSLLPARSILATDRTNKTILSSSEYTKIGIYPDFNFAAEVGVCYVNGNGNDVSIGDVNTRII